MTDDVDHDDTLPPPDPVAPAESDVGQLQALLLWARKRGFRVGPNIRIGGLTLQVRDLRQTEGRADKDDVHDEGPWKEAGYDGR